MTTKNKIVNIQIPKTSDTFVLLDTHTKMYTSNTYLCTQTIERERNANFSNTNNVIIVNDLPISSTSNKDLNGLTIELTTSTNTVLIKLECQSGQWFVKGPTITIPIHNRILEPNSQKNGNYRADLAYVIIGMGCYELGQKIVCGSHEKAIKKALQNYSILIN
ncbi:MAG: hypothetical protein WC499_04795 [Patescibacteria group bacterium]